jgi:O-methyltransferase
VVTSDRPIFRVPVGAGSMIKRLINAAVGSLGYRIERKAPAPVVVPAPNFPPDFTTQEQEIWRLVEQYTMTSMERVVSLIRAVQYVERYRIPGAFVECGVWRGGSMMAVARTLLAAGTVDRELFLFDTYSGMPQAADVDVDAFSRSAAPLLAELRTHPVEEQVKNEIVARCPLEIVRTNVISTGYPQDKLHFVEGKVENTIPKNAPSNIALLRLDTDWYESTRHELIHLFPRLSSHGILVIDDYGHWQGARLAVDEYFEQSHESVFLSRIDYTGRIGVRC